MVGGIKKKIHVIFKTAIIASLLLCSINVFAVNRYWVATTAGNWNNTANWSNSTGGAGDYSVPASGDNVVFNSSGNGDCTIDMTVVDLIRLSVVNGYTGTIDLAGYDVTVAASTSSPVFATGTINDSEGTGQLSITTTG
ncbi:MAG: hypothetical protein KAR17_06290, partial [Cyclobacteriaceae bacterium]|nr:hypothetical protein [Cyclobacteriaceae bacterium]